MRYYLDTEFDGPLLLSLALVRHDRRAELYIAMRQHLRRSASQWVEANVLPVVECKGAHPDYVTHGHLPGVLREYFADDSDINVIADWPTDFTHLIAGLMPEPASMIKIPRISMHVIRCNAYPSDLKGAIQHNALWDARALFAFIDPLRGLPE